MQALLRDRLLQSLSAQAVDLAEPTASFEGGDTAYRLDAVAEETLLEACEDWGRQDVFVLVAEGISEDGRRVFPEGADPGDARWTLIVDPVDGTRELMYDKRSAWTLAGVAANGSRPPTLADIEVAVQTELPTSRHRFADTLWAVRGEGVRAERTDLCRNECRTFPPRPSTASSIRHGFACLVKYFPGTKIEAAQLEQALFEQILPDEGPNPLVFDDQYLTSAGMLYQLVVGQARFIADLRPVFLQGRETLLTAHPYDLCTELIAREAGVIVTDERGRSLSAPLDIHAAVSWIGYANRAIREEVWPVLERLLRGYINVYADE
jgi:fructose-1,6-bisphosphatase/inositol monophosphatase family enzyme